MFNLPQFFSSSNTVSMKDRRPKSAWSNTVCCTNFMFLRTFLMIPIYWQRNHATSSWKRYPLPAEMRPNLRWSALPGMTLISIVCHDHQWWYVIWTRRTKYPRIKTVRWMWSWLDALPRCPPLAVRALLGEGNAAARRAGPQTLTVFYAWVLNQSHSCFGPYFQQTRDSG